VAFQSSICRHFIRLGSHCSDRGWSLLCDSARHVFEMLTDLDRPSVKLCTSSLWINADVPNLNDRFECTLLTETNVFASRMSCDQNHVTRSLLVGLSEQAVYRGSQLSVCLLANCLYARVAEAAQQLTSANAQQCRKRSLADVAVHVREGHRLVMDARNVLLNQCINTQRSNGNRWCFAGITCFDWFISLCLELLMPRCVGI